MVKLASCLGRAKRTLVEAYRRVCPCNRHSFRRTPELSIRNLDKAWRDSSEARFERRPEEECNVHPATQDKLSFRCVNRKPIGAFYERRLPWLGDERTCQRHFVRKLRNLPPVRNLSVRDSNARVTANIPYKGESWTVHVRPRLWGVSNGTRGQHSQSIWLLTGITRLRMRRSPTD